jgi:hypothetical protein
VLTLSEYNRRAETYVPEVCAETYRYLCETWIKYHGDDPLCDALYRLEQQHSRTLRDRGATQSK